MLKMKMLAGAGAVMMAVAAMPATAQAVQVYTNQSLFVSQRPGIATHPFDTFPAGNNPAGTTYTQNAVTFTTPLLFKNNDGVFGSGVSYLDAADNSSAASSTLSIAFGGPVLGLVLGSYFGAQTISYVVNGVSGTLAIPASRSTSFIGFDTGRATSSINATFTFGPSGLQDELDVVSFLTAVPEPASWAMMVLGVGMVGVGLRRRRLAVTTRVQFA